MSSSFYIEGELFPSVLNAYKTYKSRGGTVSHNAFERLLKASGDNPSWKELFVAPPEYQRKNGVNVGSIRKQQRAEDKQAMADMCAELDRRKNLLKE